MHLPVHCFKGSAMSITVSDNLTGYFSPATLPHRDRRGTAERRLHTEAKPVAQPESSWGRHALLAGFVGVVLGSTGVMAVLAERAASSPEPTANLETVQQPVAAVTVAAPVFDTTPVVSALVNATSAATGATTGATTALLTASRLSWSPWLPGCPRPPNVDGTFIGQKSA